MSKKNKSAPQSEAEKQSKKELLIGLLSRQGGASLDEIMSATSWLRHTTRAMLTGLRKSGFDLSKEKVEGVTHYSIVQDPAA